MLRSILTALLLFGFAVFAEAQEAPGVFVRFQVLEPANASWHVRLGGYIHVPNWYLPKGTVPERADKDETERLKSGAFSEWFDLKSHAGKLLHRRLSRAGGVAEFPNVTAQFVADEPAVGRKIDIELADKPDAASVVKRFEESFDGDLTSFLVSPDLRKDADSLETAAQMTARRLAWAQAATGGKRCAPQRHIIQTSFWSPQRPELNVQEAQVLHLLGFNVVGNQQPEVREVFPHLKVPGHTHRVGFGPANTRQGIDELIKEHAKKQKTSLKSISSDLWQPYGYRSMLERRGIYLSLVHDQYLVDMLTEQDVEAGRLKDYKVLYATGPNLTSQATERILGWVRDGGHLFASGNAGTRNEFNEPVTGLAKALGVKVGAKATTQDGVYRVRAQLNKIPHMDRVAFEGEQAVGLGPGFGVIGIKTNVATAGGDVVGRFGDGSPAVIAHRFGKGRARCVATTPGISYIKDANFVASELKEKWPTEHRRFINAAAQAAGALPQVELSHPVVEAGVFEGPEGVALVLANFTYEKIEKLTVDLAVRRPISQIYAADDPQTAIPFTFGPCIHRQRDEGFTGLSDLRFRLSWTRLCCFGEYSETGTPPKRPHTHRPWSLHAYEDRKVRLRAVKDTTVTLAA